MACGRGLKPGVWLNVDHIKPRKTHPHVSLDMNNLQILCHECDKGQGNWNNTDWR
jgi:5-methylcytosine-specific restriction endonuclease McrA